jgi:hypothetical protein
MPLTSVDFSVVQNNANPAILNFTDLSTGTDGTIVTRHISILLPNGTYLVQAGTTTTYELWNGFPGTTAIALNLIPRSVSATITVEWWNGSAAVYSKIKKYTLDLHDYVFGLGLTLDQVANNSITQDTDWYNNKMKLIVNDADAENAILFGNNTTLAQNSLDRNYNMIINQSKYFG